MPYMSDQVVINHIANGYILKKPDFVFSKFKRATNTKAKSVYQFFAWLSWKKNPTYLFYLDMLHFLPIFRDAAIL